MALTERPLRKGAERNRQRILDAAREVIADSALGASSPSIRRIVVDFPDPSGPRNPVTLAGLHGEREVIDRGLLAVVLGESFYLDHEHVLSLGGGRSP